LGEQSAKRRSSYLFDVDDPEVGVGVRGGGNPPPTDEEEYT